MDLTHRTRLAALAVAATSLAVTAAGQASDGKAPQGPAPVLAGKLRGYSVVSAGPYVSSAGNQEHASATCPGVTVPVGGGAFFTSTSTAANINGSYPGPHSWTVDVNNGGGGG